MAVRIAMLMRQDSWPLKGTENSVVTRRRYRAWRMVVGSSLDQFWQSFREGLKGQARPKAILHQHPLSFAGLLLMLAHMSRTKKVSPKRKFSGRISRGHSGVIRAGFPGQNFGQDPRNPETACISVQTSMTQGADVHDRKRFPNLKLRSGKLWAESSFVNVVRGQRGGVAKEVYGKPHDENPTQNVPRPSSVVPLFLL